MLKICLTLRLCNPFAPASSGARVSSSLGSSGETLAPVYHSLRSGSLRFGFHFPHAGSRNAASRVRRPALAACAIRHSIVCAPRREHCCECCCPCVLLSARRASPRGRVSARRLCWSHAGAAAPIPFVNALVSASQCRGCQTILPRYNHSTKRRCASSVRKLRVRLLRSLRCALLGSEPIPQNFANTSASASFNS